jgi:hypothetical protein
VPTCRHEKPIEASQHGRIIVEKTDRSGRGDAKQVNTTLAFDAAILDLSPTPLGNALCACLTKHTKSATGTHHVEGPFTGRTNSNRAPPPSRFSPRWCRRAIQESNVQLPGPFPVLRFCSEERIEQTILHLRRNSDTVIAHARANCTIASLIALRSRPCAWRSVCLASRQMR